MVSQITSLTIVYSTVYSCADQRIHQSLVSLAFALGIHRWPVNSQHKGPVHYRDVIIGAIASQIISLTIDCPSVYSCADQRKYQSTASLVLVHKWPVTRKCFHLMTSSWTRKMFPFDDVISWIGYKRVDISKVSRYDHKLVNFYILGLLQHIIDLWFYSKIGTAINRFHSGIKLTTL